MIHTNPRYFLQQRTNCFNWDEVINDFKSFRDRKNALNPVEVDRVMRKSLFQFTFQNKVPASEAGVFLGDNIPEFPETDVWKQYLASWKSYLPRSFFKFPLNNSSV